MELIDQNFVPKIEHFVTILLYYSRCKMSKNGNTWPLFKILFFKNIWIYLRFLRTVDMKDSCIVDIENTEEILLVFLTFDLRLRT